MSTPTLEQGFATSSGEVLFNPFADMSAAALARIIEDGLYAASSSQGAQHRTFILPITAEGCDVPDGIAKLGNPFYEGIDFDKVHKGLSAELHNYQKFTKPHPRIAQLFKQEAIIVNFQGKELLALLLENVGVTLNRIVECGVIDYDIAPEHLPYIASDLIEALNYLHLHGLVHGDIKPANISCLPDDETEMLRFGIFDLEGARQAPLTIDEPITYTPQFGAPEVVLMRLARDLEKNNKDFQQVVEEFAAKTCVPADKLAALGLASVNGIIALLDTSSIARVDLHSLACTLYSVLVGFDQHELFEDENGVRAEYHVLPSQNLIKDARVPERVYAVLNRASAFNPSERHESLDAFLAELTASVE